MAVELHFVDRFNSETGEPVWTSSVYATEAEALLQAAHNATEGTFPDQRIEKDGKPIHDKKSISAAGKKLKAARESNNYGHPGNYDSAIELKAVGG